MKTPIPPSFFHSIWLLASFAAMVATTGVHADQVKANNNTALQTGGSWVSGTVPGAGDNAIWNSTVSTAANCTNTLGSALTWKGIAITNPAAPVQINGSTTLTLSNGINMASATKNLILNCGTIAVATNQTWTVASGETLTTGSATNAGSVNANNNFVTLAGGGTWIMSGTGDNGSLGVTVSAGKAELNKISSSGAHAVGGPGLTINSGATAQLTGTGGDQIYNGGNVTANGTLDLYGNSETINGLNGSGTVTTTLTNGNPTLTLGGMGGSGAFTGTIEAGNTGSITLTTSNVQSVACITSGSGTSGPFINVNAGTLTLNGTADNGSAEATVASGATLLLAKTSSASAHAIGGGGLTINSGGLVQLTGTGGDQIYNGASVTDNGTLDLYGNSEAINGLNGSGIVTTTLTNGTPTLTLGASGAGGTFTGTIEAGTNGSITLTTSNVQSVACITRGNGTSGPFINVNAGTLTLNGTADNAYASATVASGATLLLDKTSSSGAHAIGNGLTINSGGTVQLTGTGGNQIYDGNSVTISGTFDLNGNSQTVGTLAFSGGTLQNSSAVNGILTDSGTLTMNGNVTVNYPNAASGSNVVLTYSGARSGSGSFVAGNLPAGMTVVDNTSAQTVSVVSGGGLITYGSTSQTPTNFPAVVVPSLNPYELVVAMATPQAYGAVTDGVTDDTAAFQNAINAVYNSGAAGGGVVWIPAGNYAFYGNLTIPTGVTLHGNWTDWTKGSGGLVGTTFKVYTTGAANGTPFITMSQSSAIRDVNIWYPNQNAASITAYPFSIGLNNSCVVQNVVLVNSYQGIETANNGGSEHILSTIIGSPLYLGVFVDQCFDVCHAEDIRFSPAVWANSGLSNAPAVNGPQASWMLANGEGMKFLRVDGDLCQDTFISGYKIGIEANTATNGQPGLAFYNGAITNCAVALSAQDMPGDLGLMFANVTLSGGIAIWRTNTSDNCNALFEHCQIIGTNMAVSSQGANNGSWMQFQNCTISNALELTGPGVFNVVDSVLLGGTQCQMNTGASGAAFTGCVFSPSQNLVNNTGNSSNLLVNAHGAISNAFPIVYWTNVEQNILSRQAAKDTLFNAKSYGATGNGTADDTAAIQSALTAAGNNGGGLVYLPAGQYHLTNTLTVPGGVELRGAYEMRNFPQPAADGHDKGSILAPYGGQGATNGPVAVALDANSGLRGVTITYENQNSNCVAYPPAIQGRGANVYAIGIMCCNPYIYVDLDSYACPNHLLYMVDGWAIETGFHIGNGSSGTIVDNHENWTAWVDDWGTGQSQLPTGVQAPVLEQVSYNLQMYVLGNCTELMVADFGIIQWTMLHFVAENGLGPQVTMINDYCDATIQGMMLDASDCTINAVNTQMVIFNFNDYPNQATAPVGVLSTTNFAGSTARFFNTCIGPTPYYDCNINGGDVGLESVHGNNGAQLGSVVNGGVFHLVNYSIDLSGGSPYNVTYGTNAGIAGKTNEFIGCYSDNGCSVVINNVSSTFAVWNDYALNSWTVLNLGPVVLGAIFPNGQYQFQAVPALTFLAGSANGINASGITVQFAGTNLAGASYVTNLTSANGLTIGGTSTARTVSAPVVTNTLYSAVLTVTDASGNAVTNSLHFDTISPAYTFEAEDFDYNSGNYINNPQTNAYANLSGTAGIDFTNFELGTGNDAYRPQGLETEPAGDTPRLAYMTGLQDYDVGFADGGNWGNYTRSFPAGTYNIFMRSASPNGPTTDCDTMYQVTAGQGTKTQTLSQLGTFTAPNTGGYQVYGWAPLLNSSGGLATFTGGSVATLRVTTVNGGNNINFYMLIPTSQEFPLLVKALSSVASQPVKLQAQIGKTPGGSALTLSWAGESSDSPASVYYAPNLTPPVTWTLVTNAPVFSNGQWMVTVPTGTGSAGFYQLR